jgi:hypothetical protein
METYNSVEDEKFLYVFGAPYKNFCKCFSLRSGVLLLAIIDLIIGTFNSLIGVWVLLSLFFGGGYRHLLAYLMLISSGVNVMGIPMAIIGISGITRLSSRHLELYYKFEVFEMFFEGFLNIIEAELTDNHLAYHTHFDTWNLFFTFLIIFLSGFATKVVWSAYIRIKYEETLMVVHGEGVFREMTGTASALVQPKVICPGREIYFSQKD